MWRHLKKFLRIGATTVLGESLLQTAQQALTLVQQQSALLADYRLIVQRYEKLNAELSALKREHADAGPDRRLNCEKAMAFRCRDANIQQGRDAHWN
jgi:hypothetical protein